MIRRVKSGFGLLVGLAILTALVLVACGDATSTTASNPVAAPSVAAATTSVATTAATTTSAATTAATTTSIATTSAVTTSAATTTTSAAGTTAAGATSAAALPPLNLSESAEAGRKVVAARCSGCHLQEGRAAGRAPQLSVSQNALDAAYVTSNIRNGKGRMPAFDQTKVSDTDLANIIAYLKAIHQ